MLCALRVSGVASAPAAVPTLADHPSAHPPRVRASYTLLARVDLLQYRLCLCIISHLVPPLVAPTSSINEAHDRTLAGRLWTVAGDAFLSLATGSGTSWTAESPKEPVPPSPAKCTFKAGFDWNEGVDVPFAHASTQQVCCDLCHARAGCQGSTFYQGKCFFKSAADVSKGLKPGKRGVVACVKGSPARPPPPPAPSPSKDDVLTINATVPGDLVTDLQNAGLIDDPLFEVNFRNSSLWHGRTWTYRTTFDTAKLSPTAGSTDVLLVLDGAHQPRPQALALPSADRVLKWYRVLTRR